MTFVRSARNLSFCATAPPRSLPRLRSLLSSSTASGVM